MIPPLMPRAIILHCTYGSAPGFYVEHKRRGYIDSQLQWFQLPLGNRKKRPALTSTATNYFGERVGVVLRIADFYASPALKTVPTSRLHGPVSDPLVAPRHPVSSCSRLRFFNFQNLIAESSVTCSTPGSGWLASWKHPRLPTTSHPFRIRSYLSHLLPSLSSRHISGTETYPTYMYDTVERRKANYCDHATDIRKPGPYGHIFQKHLQSNSWTLRHQDLPSH